MEWQPIETAPVGEWILAAPRNGSPANIVWLEVSAGTKERMWFDVPPLKPNAKYYRDGTFTHWMPLPTNPSEA